MNTRDTVLAAAVDSLHQVQRFDAIPAKSVAVLHARQQDDGSARRVVANIHWMQVEADRLSRGLATGPGVPRAD
jgi:hypothetical protein